MGFGPEFDNDLSNRSLDLWHDDAGMIAEAARTNAVVTGENAETGPPPFAVEPPVRASLAVPIAMSGQVVAVLYADDGPSNSPADMLNPGAVEVLGRYAARCLEALTAFKAARALTERPARPEASGTPIADGAETEDEASARRYARLLVSEIKLYHEAAVVDGRRDRDLGTRLGGEIARARVLYEQRVPPEVRQRADFFHDELVRTLANGDATLLELKI
jgi:GAF domain-containing protein